VIKNKYLGTVALSLMFLIISLPIAFAQEINYVLDANGNLVTGDGFYREYNELNQLIRIRESNLSTGKVLEEYVWHPVEERILIKDVYYNNTKNYTVYYVSKEYVVIENQTGNYTEEYIYQDGTLVAQVDTSGNKIAVHPDHEGSSTTFTDAQGNILETTFYSAYGEILSGGKTSRFDYEGKEFDSIVQDYDFGFRKYKPDPPIFTQPDTLIPNVYEPQSLNRYSFELNNPMKHVDPDGKNPIVIVSLGAAIVSAGWYWYSTPIDSQSMSDRLVRGLEHGLNTGVNTALVLGSEFTIAGGALRYAGKSLLKSGLVAGLGFASEDLYSSIIDDTTINGPEFGAGLAATVATSGLGGSQGGRFVSGAGSITKSDIIAAKTSLIQSGIVKISQGLTNLINNMINNYNVANANQASSNQGSTSSSGGGSSSSGGGYIKGKGYVTGDGRTYPTNNPNFVPKPNVPRVCVSGCKK